MRSLICVTLLSSLLLTLTHAALFDIHNNCPYTVWAAALPGGGRRLNTGQSWPLIVNPGTPGARIWGRTGCNFDANGSGGCTTGDCRGALECQVSGSPPTTLAEFSLDQPNNLDFIDMSLIDGFNIPMEFSQGGCRNIRCTADINGQCPAQLRTQDGCNNPCTANNGNCGPGDLSDFFRQMCPDAYSYPSDPKTFSCPSGGSYRVVFCP